MADSYSRRAWLFEKPVAVGLPGLAKDAGRRMPKDPGRGQKYTDRLGAREAQPEPGTPRPNRPVPWVWAVLIANLEGQDISCGAYLP